MALAQTTSVAANISAVPAWRDGLHKPLFVHGLIFDHALAIALRLDR